MSHKEETLQRVVALLQKDYPETVFRYALDTTRLAGTRMIPDVQIFDRGSKDLPVCVVEIGYTRPEKLSFYKEVGVPDIRWYGRDSGVLHSYGSIEPISRKVTVDYEFKLDEVDVWHSVFIEDSYTVCPAATDALYKIREELKSIPNRFAKLRYILKAVKGNGDLLNHECLGYRRPHLVEALLSDDFDKFDDYVCSNLGVDVFLTLWSNGQGIVPHLYCDVCDEHRIGDECDNESEIEYTADSFTSYAAFISLCRKQIIQIVKRGNPAEVVESECKKTAVELVEYLSGFQSTEKIALAFEQASDWRTACEWMRRERVA